jgi:ABC-2 type transport system ATP-binding protein
VCLHGTEEMLRISELTKTFPGGIQALSGISLEVPPGVFGLLGPNGAGKTTLMKIVATLLDPDAGSVVLDGLDLITEKDQARRVLGYLPQEFGFYPSLTAEQTLNYLARLKGVWNGQERKVLIDALLERVNLRSARDRRVEGLSGGMKQRLGIAQALIGQPKLIIVDEPTAGLDPEERLRFHNLLSEIAGEDVCVILSTHIVSDVSNICSQMAIIRKGKILSSCTPSAAIDRLIGSVWEATVPRDQVSSWKSRCQVVSSQVSAGLTRLRVISKDAPPGPEFMPATPSLEDFYFDLVSQPEEAPGLAS